MTQWETWVIGSGTLPLSARVKLLRRSRELANTAPQDRADYRPAAYKRYNITTLRWVLLRMAIEQPMVLFGATFGAVILWVFSFLYWFFSIIFPSAYAQNVPLIDPATGNYIGGIPAGNAATGSIYSSSVPWDQIITNFSAVPQKVVQTAVGMTGSLIQTSLVLLGLAFLGAMILSAYKVLIENKGAQEFVADFLRAAILASLALGAISNWMTVMLWIPDYFTKIITPAVAGGTSDPAVLILRFLNALGQIFESISKWVTDAREANSQDTSFAGMLWSAVTTSPFGVFVIAIWKLIIQALFIIIVGVCGTIFFAIFIAVIYGTKVILAVAMTFGPLAVAMIPFKPMSWLAMSWLRFVIITGLTVAIAYFLATILSNSMLPAINSLLTADRTGVGVHISMLIAAVMVGLVMLFGAWLLTKADDIAQALVSGGGASSGGTVAAAVVRNITKNISPKVLSTGNRPASASPTSKSGAAASNSAGNTSSTQTPRP